MVSSRRSRPPGDANRAFRQKHQVLWDASSSCSGGDHRAGPRCRRGVPERGALTGVASATADTATTDLLSGLTAAALPWRLAALLSLLAAARLRICAQWLVAESLACSILATVPSASAEPKRCANRPWATPAAQSSGLRWEMLRQPFAPVAVRDRRRRARVLSVRFEGERARWSETLALVTFRVWGVALRRWRGGKEEVGGQEQAGQLLRPTLAR